jgi:NAD(P)-dependent dehydrogenase (short-subunit alcohol dehydrogenase family)
MSATINFAPATMHQAVRNFLDYSIMKGAITAFTRSPPENLIGKGIRVNARTLGPIWTPLNPCGGADKEEDRAFPPKHSNGAPWPTQ